MRRPFDHVQICELSFQVLFTTSTLRLAAAQPLLLALPAAIQEIFVIAYYANTGTTTMMKASLGPSKYRCPYTLKLTLTNR